MRKYIKVFVILALAYIAGIVLYALILDHYTDSADVSNDRIVALNEITNNAAEHWDETDLIDQVDVGYDYVITDKQGMIICGDRGGRFSVEQAIKNGYPYTYVVKDGCIVGSVVLLENGSEMIDSMKIRMIIGFAVIEGVILIGLLAIGIYISRNIVTPFKRLEKFAHKVAEGKLDDPLMMDKDNIFGSFSESFDIMREELNKSRKREIALQKKEKEMVASLSHDLKTPVTGIKVTTELMKAKMSMENEGTVCADDYVNKLDNIYMKADQIDTLLSDLFSAALEDLGEFKVNLKDEESSEISNILRRYDDRDLVIEENIPEVVINTDIKRLSQVIGNIISNSYKYANTKIDVSYKIIDRFLQMQIRDYGPGVPENELSLIANKFYRGKQWENSDEAGNGLGLYIARILMDKMNGEMIPESDGVGLTIILLIPLS